eukprot:CAMPEP_0175206058 /NCGR_PEP_ID=MMETSP0093-20121207/12401_1 /TAXON_ID=311494 /ORGANISM="Alexandrium monilatum, Strain CCMP3105" /LENGTH=94 /DNA_ID=CAMNT_0016499179 /DNA_START=589 /DNA_END=873 /DNA_ORIENTATION=+
MHVIQIVCVQTQEQTEATETETDTETARETRLYALPALVRKPVCTHAGTHAGPCRNTQQARHGSVPGSASASPHGAAAAALAFVGTSAASGGPG